MLAPLTADARNALRDWNLNTFTHRLTQRKQTLFLVHPNTGMSAYVLQCTTAGDVIKFRTPDGVPPTPLLTRLRNVGSFCRTKRLFGYSPYWRVYLEKSGYERVFRICNDWVKHHGYIPIWGTADANDWEYELKIARETV